MFDHGSAAELEVLAEAAPGPELAATLVRFDTVQVNGHARVVVMQAWQRLASWASAQVYEAMAHVARSPMCDIDSPPELTAHFGEFAAAEIGAALALSPAAADRGVAFAYELTERLPATRAALRVWVGRP